MFLALLLGGAFALGSCEKKGPGPAADGGPKAPEKPGGVADEGGIVAGAAALDIPTSGGATVSGTVKFEGKAPEAQPLPMDKPECKKLHEGKPAPNVETLVVNANSTVKDCFVYVKAGARKYKPFKEPAVLDQRGCMYTPHVWGMMVGQDLLLKNADGFLHNVDVKENNPFNQSMPDRNDVAKRAWFKKPGVPTPFQCAVHPWMSAYACVVDHPFFSVTGADGKFEIKHLPPGKYTLGVWHERYPLLKAPTDVEIEVKEGETMTQDFTFSLGKVGA
jgi:hypothetical protein